MICSIETCDRKHYAKGFCSLHYYRWKIKGDPLVGPIKTTLCIVEGCDKPRFTKGFCNHHYYTWRVYGDPIRTKPPKLKKWKPPKIFQIHRDIKSVEYRTWSDMKSRCYNPNHEKFKNYGARGITVCDNWRFNYFNFLTDMGRRPEGKYSIERINNNGNYEPGNCKWATQKEQMNNTRRNTGKALYNRIKKEKETRK